MLLVLQPLKNQILIKLVLQIACTIKLSNQMIALVDIHFQYTYKYLFFHEYCYKVNHLKSSTRATEFV